MIKGVFRELGSDNLLSFICPACQVPHTIRMGPGRNVPPSWIIEGDFSSPTVRPSILVQYVAGEGDKIRNVVCHSMITDGVISYFNDSTHAMRGNSAKLVGYQ